jgi:hypothetical protein
MHHTRLAAFQYHCFPTPCWHMPAEPPRNSMALQGASRWLVVIPGNKLLSRSGKKSV